MSLLHKHEALVMPEQRLLQPELSIRRVRFKQMHHDFINNSLLSGVRPEDLTTRLAEDMTKRLMATLFDFDGITREGYTTFIFVSILPDGVLPKEALKLMPGFDNTFNNATILVDGPVFNEMGLPNVIPGFESQYAISYGEAPNVTSMPVHSGNEWFLEKMDAHIPDIFSL